MAEYELLKSEKNKEMLKDKHGHLYWKVNKQVLMETKGQNAAVKYGNCFYRSISLLIYATQNTWGLVRSELMQFLLLNQDMHGLASSKILKGMLRPWTTKLYSVNFVLYQPAITPRYVNFSMDLAEEKPKKIKQAGGGTRFAYHCANAPPNPMVETFMIRYQEKEKHFDVVENNFDDC
uniref:Uncharacterized protein n=1 Tax=Ditylenchus dipsaci TaxID=166011 RepID=A0A915DC04_9BILA